MMPNNREMIWGRLTLPGQFLLAGAGVMVAAMLVVGLWVSARIEKGVVLSSASAAADYVESFIAPLGDELRGDGDLSPPAIRALKEIFSSQAVQERVVSYTIWRPGGLVLFASNPEIVGQTFTPSDDLESAWLGSVAASFQDLRDDEDEGEATLGIPLLEVYSPVHEFFTGEVIAVVEFYQNATQLEQELSDARRKTWLVVGSSFLASGLLLFGIVQAGGRTIHKQQVQLERQLSETRQISRQNLALRRRAVSASSRATAQTERTIRQVGADLHDGPAQYLALAALRLDSAIPDDVDTPDADSVRESLKRALAEIRAISRGLALPDLDGLALDKLVGRAVRDHEQQTDLDVVLTLPDQVGGNFGYAQKLCVYRFLQEALSNITRHAQAGSATVEVVTDQTGLVIRVGDNGPGFNPKTALKLRSDGGQGLLGLIDRAESIGGGLIVDSAPGQSTILTLTLPYEEPSS